MHTRVVGGSGHFLSLLIHSKYFVLMRSRFYFCVLLFSHIRVTIAITRNVSLLFHV